MAVMILVVEAIGSRVLAFLEKRIAPVSASMRMAAVAVMVGGDGSPDGNEAVMVVSGACVAARAEPVSARRATASKSNERAATRREPRRHTSRGERGRPIPPASHC